MGVTNGVHRRGIIKIDENYFRLLIKASDLVNDDPERPVHRFTSTVIFIINEITCRPFMPPIIGAKENRIDISFYKADAIDGFCNTR